MNARPFVLNPNIIVLDQSGWEGLQRKLNDHFQKVAEFKDFGLAFNYHAGQIVFGLSSSKVKPEDIVSVNGRIREEMDSVVAASFGVRQTATGIFVPTCDDLDIRL